VRVDEHGPAVGLFESVSETGGAEGVVSGTDGDGRERTGVSDELPSQATRDAKQVGLEFGQPWNRR
jgi:hypothetical protein